MALSWIEIIRRVSCPKCGALVGSNCRTANGNESWEPHAPRVRKARQTKAAYLNTFECSNCGATNMSADDVAKLDFPGNREEPAEYVRECPECGAPDPEEMVVHFCNGCDLEVPGPNMTCVECQLEDAIQENRNAA